MMPARISYAHILRWLEEFSTILSEAKVFVLHNLPAVEIINS